MANAPQRVGHRRGFLWIIAIVLLLLLTIPMAITGIGPFGLGEHSLGVNFEIASAVLGLVLTGIIIWWSRQRGRFDPFEFPVWISLNVYIQMILNVWLLQRDRIIFISWLKDSYTIMYPLAVLLFGVGLVVMWLAYVWMYRRRERNLERLQPQTVELRLSLTRLIWIFGWIGGLLSVVSGRVGYLASGDVTWANYLGLVNVIYAAATAALMIWHFRNPSASGWVWFGIVVTTEVGTSMIVASRSFAVTLITLGMYMYYARRRLPTRWLVISGILVVLLVPVVNNFRAALHSNDSGLDISFTDRLGVLGSTFIETINQPISNSFETTTDLFTYRQGALLDITASAVYLHPDHLPYVGEEMIEYLIPQLVPRVLYPSKSTSQPAIMAITETYVGVHTSQSAIGVFADTYRAGGWISVVVWFVLFGVMGAWLYLQGPAGNNLAWITIYVTLITLVMRYDTDIMTMMLHLIQWGILLWLIVTRLMFVRTYTQSNTQTILSSVAGRAVAHVR